jgi:glycosyltransferase involved in cell wall biosynthesis
MKISIITVVYNRVSTIKDTILSILAQSYNNIEYIVIDGGSTDGTLEVLQSFNKNINILVSEPDQDVIDAMNKGLKLATGDVIGFLNSDDIFFNEYVINEIAYIFLDININACHADLLYTDAKNLNKIVRYWKSCSYEDGLFQKGMMPASPTFYVRRSVYEEHGGFINTRLGPSDFELALRFLHVHKIKSKYIPKIWIKMRIGGDSNKSLFGMIKSSIGALVTLNNYGVSCNFIIYMTRKLINRLNQYLYGYYILKLTNEFNQNT